MFIYNQKHIRPASIKTTFKLRQKEKDLESVMFLQYLLPQIMFSKNIKCYKMGKGYLTTLT